jgi:hypothetical protein
MVSVAMNPTGKPCQYRVVMEVSFSTLLAAGMLSTIQLL